jgi:hypothetical protein
LEHLLNLGLLLDVTKEEWLEVGTNALRCSHPNEVKEMEWKI